MNRFAFASAVAFLSCTVTPASSFAQAKQAIRRPRRSPPHKPPGACRASGGCRQSRRRINPDSAGTGEGGGEIVTTVKIKNMSTGSINLLKADQDGRQRRQQKRNMVTTATAMRKPFLLGEVIELSCGP
jgi:hypothetical protein